MDGQVCAEGCLSSLSQITLVLRLQAPEVGRRHHPRLGFSAEIPPRATPVSTACLHLLTVIALQTNRAVITDSPYTQGGAPCTGVYRALGSGHPCMLE